MKRTLAVATVMALSLVGIATAQTPNGIERQAQAEIAQWEDQKAAAYSDIKLTEDVSLAFDIATNPAGGLPSPVNVNAAIRPLRDRFPDYRLNYRSDADYCPIERAILDARSAALKRALLAIESIRSSTREF